MIYDLRHSTTYDYTSPVSVSHHLLRLAPRELINQQCLSHEVKIDPPPTVSKPHIDYFGNAVSFVTVEGSHRKLVVAARSRVSRTRPSLPDPSETPAWESVRDFCRGEQIGTTLEACDYIFDSGIIKMNAIYAPFYEGVFTRDRPILEAVLALTARIHTEFRYDPKATSLETPIEEVFRSKRGVCQDFAQFQIACLRSLGLPARYVSGYLNTDPPPGKPRLVGSDATHAWVSFYIPGIGWVDVDPTNNVIPTDRHITIAWGRDYTDVSPLRGVILGNGNHQLKVAVDVVPITEAA